MIGRTNAVCVISGGGSGGVTTVDLPTHPASISRNAKNQNVDIALTYTSTDFVSGVRVAYKTGAYPENPDDGEFVDAEGAAETVNVPNLSNGATYYFRVFLYREVGGVRYFQSDITNARTSCIPRAVEISGITPMVEAADHIVITESGTFTLTANAGTKIIIGSAGGGQIGGFVAEHTIAADVVNETCTLTVSAARTANSSKLVVGSNSYGCGATEQIVQSKWGPIGGRGGDAGQNGAGAGGGGGGITNNITGKAVIQKAGGNGGNNGGYGNYGGNGGVMCAGEAGASGLGSGFGSNNIGGGSGGGGGYASGGGSRGDTVNSNDPQFNLKSGSSGGPGTGIIVIEWD